MKFNTDGSIPLSDILKDVTLDLIKAGPATEPQKMSFYFSTSNESVEGFTLDTIFLRLIDRAQSMVSLTKGFKIPLFNEYKRSDGRHYVFVDIPKDNAIDFLGILESIGVKNNVGVVRQETVLSSGPQRPSTADDAPSKNDPALKP